MVINYLQSGDLLSDEKKAREIVMVKSRYVLIDNIILLYHLAVDNSLRTVLPKENRLAVIKKVHKGSTQRKICMTPEGC